MTQASSDDIPPVGWWQVLLRAARRVKDEEGLDQAAALTYYSLLAMFPAFIALVAIVGVLGQQSTVDGVIDGIESIGSEQAAEAFRGPAQSVVDQKSAAGTLLGLGLLTALWAASGYVGAFARAMNRAWQAEEGRPFWRLRPYLLGLTVVLVVASALVVTGAAISGGLARRTGRAIGLGDEAVLAWNIAKWPVMLVIVALMVALLYWATPNVRQPRFRWLSPGAGLAILVWIVASAGFGIYVASFGSYNATYGALGGVIVLLVWLWLTNVALLVGAHLDVELERERELRSGLAAARERIQLPAREPASG